MRMHTTLPNQILHPGTQQTQRDPSATAAPTSFPRKLLYKAKKSIRGASTSLPSPGLIPPPEKLLAPLVLTSI